MKSFEYKTGLLFDLFFCLIFMPLLVVLGPAHHWWRISPVFTCVAIAYLCGCYFATKSLQLPKLILSRLYGRLSVIIVSFLILTYLLTLYPLPKMDFVIPSMTEYQTRMRNYNMAVAVWFMFSVIMCYSLTVAFIKELYHRRMVQGEIESQRDKAQLALFKAQINPHFLFNTLNSLYSLVVGTSEKAEDAFIKFSELLEYTYRTADNDWVTIMDEINYISNYIDLQLIRLGSRTKVEWIYEVDEEETMVPPMIFLTFVENAFKYGSSTSRECGIRFSLILEKGHLGFETENEIVRYSDDFRKDMPVGIQNCRNRLSVLFPENYELDIKEKNGVFSLRLEINMLHNSI